MAELLLVGTTHYPPLIYPDEGMYSQLRKHVESDRTPPDMKIESNWPEAMQQEYGPNGCKRQGLCRRSSGSPRLILPHPPQGDRRLQP